MPFRVTFSPALVTMSAPGFAIGRLSSFPKKHEHNTLISFKAIYHVSLSTEPLSHLSFHVLLHDEFLLIRLDSFLSNLSERIFLYMFEFNLGFTKECVYSGSSADPFFLHTLVFYRSDNGSFWFQNQVFWFLLLTSGWHPVVWPLYICSLKVFSLDLELVGNLCFISLQFHNKKCFPWHFQFLLMSLAHQTV